MHAPGRFEGRSLLVSLTGRDRPGVSSALFRTLADFDVAVLDVEQVTIRGRLVLGALLTCPPSDQEVVLRDAVADLASELGLDCEIHASSGDHQVSASTAHVTIIGAPLAPHAMAEVATTLARQGANIDRIARMAAWPVTAIEMDVSGSTPGELQVALAETAVRTGVDIAVQRGGLARRAKRLIVMDVDSTLIQNEVIDLLAGYAGVEDQVAAITGRAMNGEIDFAEALTERVALLAGLSETALATAREALVLTPGARTLVRTLHRLDHRVGVVSGGFIEVIAPLVEELGIDFVRANSLEVEDGRLTGRLIGPIIDRAGKAQALAQFAEQAGVSLEQCVAIGDGANDLDMIESAGLGIAFNAKQIVRDHADTAFTLPYLDSVLYLLGIAREEFDDSHAADLQDAQG
jgi:phosphoserine phosphatase